MISEAETELRHNRGEVLLASANHIVYPRPGRLHQDGIEELDFRIGGPTISTQRALTRLRPATADRSSWEMLKG
jgi:hypothetical protein